ncbi:gustatory receptor for sugar taste 64a-like [Amyelois transitella]|uniref:gustatory receptor for sugar taste 64a-like n=1 Tax=Amyelois transitella TaxID=680683 RepID=UPI0029907CF0|nr:gustatory receptor for sugar taste 64a-like [Amyelois transitella]
MLDSMNHIQNLANHELLLPNRPFYDDFIYFVGTIFHYSCWFGIVGSGRPVWKAWSLILLIMLVTIEGSAIWKVIRALAGWAVDVSGNRSVTARLAGTMFYANSIICLVLTSRLAASWEKQTALWIAVERAMTLNIPPDATIKKRMIIVTIVMSVCGCVEHFLSVVSQIDFNLPASTILKQYILSSHGFLFMKSSYSCWLALPLLFISNIATILWGFQDFIIIVISMGLTSRYHRLNQFVAKLCALEKQNRERCEKTEPIKVYTWRKIREAYVKQAMLVRTVNDGVGALITLSCFVNFYFISLQLFLGITQGLTGGLLKQVYYIVSLCWVVMRISGVVLAASDVNLHSKMALQYLHGCNFKYYNVEVDRLQNQLTKDYVALSGMGFFTLTKTILLQMAGSVITYELVLIQFDDKGTNDSVNVTKS